MSEAEWVGEKSTPSSGTDPVVDSHRGLSFGALHAFSVLEWLAIGALVLALVARFGARPHAPLWLDETATGAIVGQPDFKSFWREMYWGISSPLYLVFMRAWQAVFGLSNAALRTPSLIFSAAAPFAIAFARLPSLTRTERLTWAAIVGLWIPGIGYAQDARYYGLLLLLATIQTLAFVELLRMPSLRRAAVWVSACTLTIITHYDAAVLAIVQGVLFLALKRGGAVKTWPAVLLVTPALASIAWQWPEMAPYAHPGTTWFKIQNGPAVFGDALYLLGSAWWLSALLLLVAAIRVARLLRPSDDAGGFPSEVVWTGVASVLGAAALIALGTVKPILAQRYLAPFAPGVLLFLITTLRIVGREAWRASLACLLVIAVAVCVMWMAAGSYHIDSVVEPLNYEQASARLMTAGVRRVVFTWDNPSSRAAHPEQLAAFGGFFFRRAGVPVEVIPIQIGPNDDPNTLLLQAAEPSNAAILWIYDTWVTGTAAAVHPPRISSIDPRWRCEKTGTPAIGIVTCIPDARVGRGVSGGPLDAAGGWRSAR